jgi:hypothetical protein
MKFFLLIAPLFLAISVSGQSGSRLFFLTHINKETAYIELNGNEGVVFFTKRYSMGPYSISSIRDTVSLIIGENGRYSGDNWQIQRIKTKDYLIQMSGSSGSNPKYTLSAIAETDVFNECVNEAYWFGQWEKMIGELNRQFPMSSFSVFHTYHYWKNQEGVETDYRGFYKEIDNRLAVVKKELVLSNTRLTGISTSIFSAIDRADYTVFKDSIASLLTVKEGENYFYRDSILKRICSEQPSWFFRLEEDLSAHKTELLHWGIAARKSTVAPLKSVESHQHLKKELFRKRRADRIKTVSIASLAITGELAIIGGVIYLIAR